MSGAVNGDVTQAFAALTATLKQTASSGKAVDMLHTLNYAMAVEKLEETYNAGQPVGGVKEPGKRRGRKSNAEKAAEAAAAGSEAPAEGAETAVENAVAETEGGRRRRV